MGQVHIRIERSITLCIYIKFYFHIENKLPLIMINKKNKLHPKESFHIAPFKKHIQKTRPHIHHGYLEIVYLFKGAGSHFIDDQNYSMDQPSVSIIKNGQVHHWDLSTEADGFVILIQNDFFPQCNDVELEQLGEEISQQDYIQVKEPETITSLCRIINMEYPTNNQILFNSLFKAILSKLLEHAPIPQPIKKHQSDYKKFFLLVERHVEKERTVIFYAKQMHTTPQNLNSICKKCVGMSASRIIADVIIKRSKRLLKYSSLSINEISYQMNFNDPSHYVKFFKRITEQTPNSYRKMNE